MRQQVLAVVGAAVWGSRSVGTTPFGRCWYPRIIVDCLVRSGSVRIILVEVG